MNKKMTTCKACGHDIAKSAKSCPHCGARNKKKHPILLGFIILFIVVGVLGSTEDSNEPKRTNRTDATNSDAIVETEVATTTAQIEKEDVFYVGETAVLKGVSVTLLSVTESTGSDYNKPTDGNVFVLCEFEIANDSDTEINVSSMMSFEAYCDDYTCTFSLGALMEKGNKNQLDGTVASGKKFNGVIGYEVPTDWKELEVRFTPDFWSGREIIFVASK